MKPRIADDIAITVERAWVPAAGQAGPLILDVGIFNASAKPIWPLCLDPTGAALWPRVHAISDAVVLGFGRFRAAPWDPASARPIWPTARRLEPRSGATLGVELPLPMQESGLSVVGSVESAIAALDRVWIAIECVRKLAGKVQRWPNGAEDVAAAAKRIDLALACVTLPQPVAVQRVVSAPGPLGDGPHCAMNAWLPVALQREG